MTPLKWGIILLALYSAAGGFILQKRFLCTPANAIAASKSTPERRWMAGNILRIAFAEAVGLYGMVLHFIGGPDRLAASLIGVSLILLLIWKPGVPPTPEPQERS